MASPALETATEARGNAPDLTGVIILGCCVLWALITATGRAARPEGVLLAVLAVAAGYAFGRICGALLPVAAPAVAALTGLALVLTAPHGLPGSVTGPSGRAGASAALLALSTGAACCAAWGARSRRMRLLLCLPAAAAAPVALLTGSVPALVAVLGVLLGALAAERTGGRAVGLAGLALVTAAVAAGTWAAAAGMLPPGAASSLEGQLTEHRLGLWRDALALAVEHPVLGSGPDSFGELSPTARSAAAAEDRPHSAPLQIAAEQGLPGLVLLGAVFGWLLLALWRSPRPTPVVLSAGAALTVVAGLASVGNPLSFSQITMGAGLLAGFATARPSAELL